MPYENYPKEFWEGKPLNFKDGRSYTLAAGLGPYETVLPEFDLRAIFTKDYIVEFGYSVNNRDDFNVVYIRGDFNVSGGSFQGGVMTDYTWSHVSPNMAYQDISVITYFTGSKDLKRLNYNDRTWHMNYTSGEPTISYHQQYHQDGSVSWTRRAAKQANGTDELVSYEVLQDEAYTVTDISSLMLSDGIPAALNFESLKVNYDLKETRFYFGFNDVFQGFTPKSDKQIAIFSTADGVDILTGSKNKPDIFSFDGFPEYGDAVDKITNYSKKDKDIIHFSKSAFGLSVGKFAIARNSKKLHKLLASDVNIVYNQKKGELIFNANGPKAGFGDDGGVFALLVGSPKLSGVPMTFV